MQYRIVSSLYEDIVSSTVTNLLKDGWQLLGELKVCLDSSSVSNRSCKYTQVMVKYENN
jgi:hypothetical protein